MGLPISRITLRSNPNGRVLSAQEHQAAFCIAYAAPTYPVEAQRQGIEGIVVLDAVIGKSGEILTLSVESGDPLLADSALQAVRHWAYRPTKINGIPVEVQRQIEVPFRLPETDWAH